MKTLFCAVGTSALLLLSTTAYSQGLKPLSLPGSTWSAITFPAGAAGDETHNVTLQGKIEQGAVWVRFGEDKKWELNTYVNLGYSLDKYKFDYNNKITSAAGVKVSRRFDSGVADVGVQIIHERRWINNKSGTGVQAYASYWFGWDLKK